MDVAFAVGKMVDLHEIAMFFYQEKRKTKIGMFTNVVKNPLPFVKI